MEQLNLEKKTSRMLKKKKGSGVGSGGRWSMAFNSTDDKYYKKVEQLYAILLEHMKGDFGLIEKFIQ